MAYGQALMPFKICGLRCALNHKEPPRDAVACDGLQQEPKHYLPTVVAGLLRRLDGARHTSTCSNSSRTEEGLCGDLKLICGFEQLRGCSRLVTGLQQIRGLPKAGS